MHHLPNKSRLICILDLWCQSALQIVHSATARTCPLSGHQSLWFCYSSVGMWLWPKLKNSYLGNIPVITKSLAQFEKKKQFPDLQFPWMLLISQLNYCKTTHYFTATDIWGVHLAVHNKMSSCNYVNVPLTLSEPVWATGPAGLEEYNCCLAKAKLLILHLFSLQEIYNITMACSDQLQSRCITHL